MLRRGYSRVVIAALLVPHLALAGSVYLNGTNIDGVTGVKFEKATVRIDEQGNVLIEAPGYKVVQGAAGGPGTTAAQPPAPSKITKRYWLVLRQSAKGMAEYDVDVYINAKWILRLRNDQDDDAIDITKHVSPGANTVLFEAKKVAGGPRKSFSVEHSMTVVVGEGNEGGGNVLIDNALATFKRTAADTDSVAQEFSFTAR